MFRFFLIALFLCVGSLSYADGNFDYLDKIKNGGVYAEVGGRCGFHIEVLKDKGEVFTTWVNANGFCGIKGTWDFLCAPVDNRCKTRLFLKYDYTLSVLPSGNLLLEGDIGRFSVFQLRTKACY